MAAFAQVVVDVPTAQTDKPFDYAIPKTMQARVEPGMRVRVPFGRGNRTVFGMVVATHDKAPEITLKPLATVLDEEPVMNQEALELSRWLAAQSFAFWITCIQTMLPALLNPDAQQQDRAQVKTATRITSRVDSASAAELRAELRPNARKQAALLDLLVTWANEPHWDSETRGLGFARADLLAAEKRGWLRLEQVEIYRQPYELPAGAKQTQPKKLTSAQAAVEGKIRAALQTKQNETFLLEGVTGSGKTEVYLQAIAQTLANGRNALMLVPEIALTPQMVHRVLGRFGSQVAVLHSGLSDGERYDEWRRIQQKEVRVVVGARSAIFAPLENIGLIVIDEEHETSYKQEDTPRYHVRDVALKRAATHQAVVVLGSATPSLESRARALKGVYTLLSLPERINRQPLPEVKLIDMRTAGKQGDFSQTLLEALQERQARGEQSVLLLNRRGYSSFVMCRECGFVVKCPNCDISLTLHMDTHSLRCHYCGHEEPIPSQCPNCQSTRIRYYGTGTQKIETSLQELLPEARVLRMDVDTTRRKGAHEKILAAFGRHEADILLGTQMIAKGLDFANVTLVGVINADTGLNAPDFRASERTFDLLTQVAGRAGRADKSGEVLIQTYNPDHYAIQFAKHHDYEGFFRREMAFRHAGKYPPYYFTVRLTVSHPEEAQAAKAMFSLADLVRGQLSDQALVLGPSPAAIARMKNRYFYQMVIKYKHEPALEETLLKLLNETQARTREGFYIGIDREPLSFI